MATLPTKNALADLTGGYYSYWTDGTTEGRATLAVILGSTDAQAAAASFSSLALGTALPASSGGTGLTSIATLLNSNVTPATLGLVIGTNVQAWDADLDALALDPLTATTAASTYQPLDSDLTAIAALNPTANNLIYKSGGDTWDTTTITTFGRSLVDDSNASTARTTLGLVIGTDVQEWDANLDQLAALTPASSLIIGNGLGGYEMVTPANFITNNNILDTADIGVSVQAYSATLAAISAGTWTGASSITTVGALTSGSINWTGNIVTTGTGTFGTLTVGSGSITDTSGAISFGNENLSTTGTFSSGAATVIGGITLSTTGRRIIAENDGQELFFAGGDATNKGGNLTLYSGSHATLANDIRFRASATTVYYYDHSATSHTFTGTLGVSGGKTSLAASTTARATLNIPSGTAPTSPTNGDIWSDGSDLLVRLGGTTYTLTKA